VLALEGETVKLHCPCTFGTKARANSSSIRDRRTFSITPKYNHLGGASVVYF